jgi:hypothetical protein
MKVNWLRLKYRLRAALHPGCWAAFNKVDRAWDKELWDALTRGDIDVVGRFQAIVGDKPVWIENHPYASGSLDLPGRGLGCSRATALYLRDCLPSARLMQRLKGVGPDFEVCCTRHGHIIT